MKAFKIIFKNKFCLWTQISSILNNIGSSIYNLVFITYVAMTFNDKFLIGIANTIIFIPFIVNLFLGIKADRTKNRGQLLMLLPYIQGILFIIVAYLTNQPTILAFSIVCLINVISDCMGTFRGMLINNYYKNLISENELFHFFSIRSSIGNAFSILGQALGIYLLKISNYNFALIAMINAVSFIVSSLFLFKIRKELAITFPIDAKISLFQSLKESFTTAKELIRNHYNLSLYCNLGYSLIINTIFNAVTPILTIYLLDQKYFMLDYGQSLLLIEISATVVVIISGLFPDTYLGRMNYNKLAAIETILLILLGIISIFYPSIYVILALLLVGFYISTKTSAKWSSTLIHNLPDEKINQVSTFIGTIVTILMPVGTAVFSILASVNNTITWISFAILAAIALFLITRKQDVSNQ